MCGISGVVGIADPQKRYALVSSLGGGIDTRGGDACGFAGYNKERNKFEVGKKLGYWSERRRQFVERAASAHLTMMHSRWATCGKKTVDEAHPFAVKRGGRIVLYGAHNGRVYNGYRSAKEHGREIAVDSQEIFELLADNDYEGICNLEGYGVITWIDTNNPTVINLLRLSDNSDIFVVETKDKKVIYGSTEDIVDSALKDAGLTYKDWLKINVGTVYQLTDDGVFYTSMKNIKFKEYERIPESGVDWAEAWRQAFESYQDTSSKKSKSRFKNNRGSKKKSRVSEYPQSIGTIGNPDYIDLDELFDLACDNCCEPIEEEDFGELSILYESVAGNKSNAGIYCKSCLLPATG